MGKRTGSLIRLSLVIMLLASVAGGYGCGPKQSVTIPETPPETGPAEEMTESTVSEPTGEAEAVVLSEPEADGDEPAPALDEQQVSALLQEAKNYMQLGQEHIGGGGDAVEGLAILAEATERYLQIIEGGGESSMRSGALLDYITVKDYFARTCRDTDHDIPSAIAHYEDVIEAIGDSINSQKQFYYLVTAELYRFELGDLAAARELYQASLDYCSTIETGNFSACTEWEMLQIHHALDLIEQEQQGDQWAGFTSQNVSLPSRDFENYYLLAAGLLDSAEMKPEIWTKETGYTDEFYGSSTNLKTIMDVLLINCFHGETLAATDPLLGDSIVEKNFQRLLSSYPEHPATMMMLVKQSIHSRRMLRTDEAQTYSEMAGELAGKMNMTLIVDPDPEPVQEFLRREYPAALGTEAGDEKGD